MSDKIPAYDWILAFLSTLPALYVIINDTALNMRLTFMEPLSTPVMILGALNIVLLIEAIRRAAVPAMAMLIGIFFLYFYVAPYFSGVFYSKPTELYKIIEMQFLITDAGIYGSITGIAATFVALFIIFGAIMEKTETGKFFTDLACRLAGRSKGGPAKVSVISSCFFGSISGVATANVYAIGTFTIPMMKKLGYRPQFAGAVEAVAASGGQYMPPVMGAGAFVMSEITGIPYLKICIAAALPALLYYGSLVLRVHFIAIKDNLKAMKEEEIGISLRDVLKDSYMLLPVVVLLVMLISGFSVFIAAMWAIALSFLISFSKKHTRMTPSMIMETLITAGKNMVMIACCCAGAGMIVATVTYTGLALGIAAVIVNWAGGFLLPALILIMVVALILGMGMPCTPAYIIAITIGGPALLMLGIPLLAAHLFVFYFAILAEVTPPVCIPAYCAASIAQSDPMLTGFEAFKLALIAFVVPYIYVYNQALLLQGGLAEIISLVLVMIIAIAALSSAVSGCFFKKLDLFERAFLAVLGFGGVVLCTYRSVVGHPITLVVAASIILAFLSWVFVRTRGGKSLYA